MNFLLIILSGVKSYLLYILVKIKHNRRVNTLLNNENSILYDKLLLNGYVEIPNYFSSSDCNTIINDIRKAEIDYPESVWSGSLNSDKRIFGIELLKGKILDFHSDSNLLKIGEKLFNGKLINFQTLAGHLTYVKGNIGSGEGWHRDGYNFQYKALVYLSDVDENNGPFQLISSSNKFWQSLLDNLLTNKKFGMTRYLESEIQKILIRKPERLITVKGKAGTLLIVDTSCIHRGAPILSGERFALTNYYYPEYLKHQYEGHFLPRLTLELTNKKISESK